MKHPMDNFDYVITELELDGEDVADAVSVSEYTYSVMIKAMRESGNHDTPPDLAGMNRIVDNAVDQMIEATEGDTRALVKMICELMASAVVTNFLGAQQLLMSEEDKPGMGPGDLVPIWQTIGMGMPHVFAQVYKQASEADNGDQESA